MKQYRLPNQSYKCGNSLTGIPCAVGPIGSRCSHNKDDVSGDACRPLRTLVWWSRSIQVVATLIALLGVSLAWSNLGLKQSVAPGLLSRSHAQLLVSAQGTPDSPHGIDPENRCASCHPGNSSAAANAMQSDLCMKCHGREMPDAVLGSPHDLQGDALAELVANGTRPIERSFLTKLVGRSPINWKGNATECSQCHREHQGAANDLTNMTSARCQACHQTAFHSFSTDHPEFKDYPYRGEKSIAFDHVKHRDLHFTKKGTSFDCKSCHVQADQVGAVGQVFRSVSFDQACASCHLAPVKSALQDGLIVLQVPSVNSKEMMTSGSDIGSWPKQSSQLTDGAIPPVMRLLIESEPGGMALLDELPTSGRLVELDSKDPKARDTLMKLASMTRQLIQKIANEGQPGFRAAAQRLLETAGTNDGLSPTPEFIASSKPWLDRFASGIPPDLFRAAWNEWFEDRETGLDLGHPTRSAPIPFPGASANRPQDDDLLLGSGNALLNPSNDSFLNDSFLNKDSSDLLRSESNTKIALNGFKDSRTWDQLAFGGWMIDRQRMAIVYVPSGHADAWLSRWIELEQVRQGSSTSAIGQEERTKIPLAQQCTQCHSLSISGTKAEPRRHDNWSVSFREANRRRSEGLISEDGSNACWKSKRRAANLKPITKFDHGPHLTLPKLNDCQSCHQLGQVDFIPMQKNQCSSCHQSQAAGESCTQCHNYHVGAKGWIGQRLESR